MSIAQPSLVAGDLLAELFLPLAPQRSKHNPTVVAGKLSKRADGAWASWRASAVMLLRSQWRGRAALYVPVVVGVVAVFPRPGKARRTYTIGGVERPYPWEWTSGRVPFVGVPDWDQVGKAAVDVVKQAGILVDDPLVVGATGFERWYAAEGERPSVSVRLWSAVVAKVAVRDAAGAVGGGA